MDGQLSRLNKWKTINQIKHFVIVFNCPTENVGGFIFYKLHLNSISIKIIKILSYFAVIKYKLWRINNAMYFQCKNNCFKLALNYSQLDNIQHFAVFKLFKEFIFWIWRDPSINYSQWSCNIRRQDSKKSFAHLFSRDFIDILDLNWTLKLHYICY